MVNQKSLRGASNSPRETTSVALELASAPTKSLLLNKENEVKSHKANINKTVSDYIAAREAKAEAEEALKKAESAMRLAMAADSVDSVIVDGVKVSLVEGRRPSYDVDKLQQMIKPNLFKSLVKMVVDGEKFKAAVKLGSLASDVAEACTTYSEYTQVRVTAQAEKKEDASVANVA